MKEGLTRDNANLYLIGLQEDLKKFQEKSRQTSYYCDNDDWTKNQSKNYDEIERLVGELLGQIMVAKAYLREK